MSKRIIKGSFDFNRRSLHHPVLHENTYRRAQIRKARKKKTTHQIVNQAVLLKAKATAAAAVVAVKAARKANPVKVPKVVAAAAAVAVMIANHHPATVAVVAAAVRVARSHQASHLVAVAAAAAANLQHHPWKSFRFRNVQQLNPMKRRNLDKVSRCNVRKENAFTDS